MPIFSSFLTYLDRSLEGRLKVRVNKRTPSSLIAHTSQTRIMAAINHAMMMLSKNSSHQGTPVSIEKGKMKSLCYDIYIYIYIYYMHLHSPHVVSFYMIILSQSLYSRSHS